MDFESAVHYLRSFLVYEDKPKYKYSEKTFDLQRVRDFLDGMKIDYKKLKYVHVAGSKGKGSVATMIADYLKESGLKTGLFTSPYMLDICESCRLDGKYISRKEFAEYTLQIKKYLTKNGSNNLTYFELLTGLVLKYFVDKKVDYAVMEVGLGGRLDSTNVITPKVAVLSAVELEHTNILGKTLSKILDEKLGILKKNVPLVIGYQKANVKKMIKEKVGRKNKMVFVDEVAGYKNPKMENGNLISGYSIFGKTYKKVAINGVNRIQVNNAILALVTLKTLLGKLDENTFRKALLQFKMVGRFDIRKIDGHTVVLDMAHTLKSIGNLIDSLKHHFPDKKYVFLISIMKDKDAKNILGQLANVATEMTFTLSHPIRSLPVNELNSLARRFKVKKMIEKDSKKAYKNLFRKLKKDQVLVVTGSHFLVRSVLVEKPFI